MYKTNNSWYSDFWHEGKRHRKSWGPISKTMAKEKEGLWRADIRKGIIKKSRKIRFETLAEKYEKFAELNKKPSTARRNKSSLNMLRPHFKGKLIGSINSWMAEKYKSDRIKGGSKPATVNRDIDVLRNMMKKAVEWGCLYVNPLVGVKHLKENNEKMWVLTDEEEEMLLNECHNRPQRRKKKYLKDLVHFALNTGMRQGEIFNLKKLHLKIRKRYVTVVDSKNSERRNVPLNDTALEIARRRLKASGSDYLFCNSRDRKLTQLTNAFWTAVKESGLIRYEGKEKIRFRFHDCRHTFGSRLGMDGTDLKTIMEIMGHKTHKMAMRYQHPAPDHKLAAVQNLGKNHPQKSPRAKIVELKNNIKSA